MNITRRHLFMGFAAWASGCIVRAQQLFRGWPWDTLVFQTTKGAGFSPVWTKTGSVLHWVWHNGTHTDSNSPTKNLQTSGTTKTIRVQSQDGFKTVTSVSMITLSLVNAMPSFALCTALVTLDCSGNIFTGALPSFAACTALVTFKSGSGFSGSLPLFAACTQLVTFHCDNASFSGSLPSFSACTQLVTFAANSNSFSGSLPSFAACIHLAHLTINNNSFSGTIPSFAACTELIELFFGTPTLSNNFSDVVAGSFATQKSLADAWFNRNALVQSAVDQILADFVASLSIPGRVHCTVDLTGGTNSTPSAAGLASKALLVAAGWTVTNN